MVFLALFGLNSILYWKTIVFYIELQLRFLRARKLLLPEQWSLNEKYVCYHPKPFNQEKKKHFFA